jgi:hypothetical protein
MPGAVVLAAALAGCSSFGFGQSEQKAVDPNVFPADYKTRLTTFMQSNPYGLVGAREAGLAAPELKAFGTETRYVACLRAVGPDWRKEKAIIFFGGEINQFVDATPEQCGAAAYQPFPELLTMLRAIGGKK